MARSLPSPLPNEVFVGGLALLLLTYNATIWLTRGSEVWTIVSNLLLGGAVVILGAIQGLGWNRIGLLTGNVGRTALVSLLGLVTFLASLLVARGAGNAGALLGAQRAGSYEGGALLVKLLFTIPVATAFVEELAFRGVLFAAWLRITTLRRSTLGSSLVFGLWHVFSSLRTLPSDVEPTSAMALRSVGVSVLATFILGIGLCLLRQWTGSIYGGVLVHAGFNLGGVVGSVLARGG